MRFLAAILFFLPLNAAGQGTLFEGPPTLFPPPGFERSDVGPVLEAATATALGLKALRGGAQAETGLAGQPVDNAAAELLGLDTAEGVVLTAVDPKSGFARTGFRPGDVVTAVEGAPVASVEQIARRMAAAPEPDVMVDYMRGRERGSVLVSRVPPLDLALAPPPAPDAAAEPPTRRVAPSPAPTPRAQRREERREDRAARRGRSPDGTELLPGFRLTRVDRAAIERYSLNPNASGVLVLSAGEFGETVGLQGGDVIALINGTRVEGPGMVRAALSRPGRYRLSVIRGKERVVLGFAI